MAVVEVACPSCKATLKAPDNMAGKKARCKKCNASFRIPGVSETGDSIGDSQMLSAVDVPAPPHVASAFDFSAKSEPPPEPKKPQPKPTAPPKSEPRPVPKKPVAPVSDNPFSFGDEPVDSPKAPPPQPKSPPPPPKEKSTPKAKAMPPEPKPTAKRAATTTQPATAGGFDFDSILDAANEEPVHPKSKSGHKAPGLVDQSFKMPDDAIPDAEAVPDADAVPDAESANEDDFLDDEPVASGDPFGFPGQGQSSGPKSTRLKSKARPKDVDDDEPPHRGGYHKPAGSSGKTKLILAIVGVVMLGGAIAGVAVFVNKAKNNDQAKATDKDKEKKTDTPADPTPEPPKNDPKGKDITATPKDLKGKDTTSKTNTSSAKATNPGSATTEPPPRAMLTLEATVKTITPQAARAKQEHFHEPSGMTATIDAEIDKVLRFFPPGKSDSDIGVLWEKEKAFAPNTPGNKLVMDICRQSGTMQHRIEFTGDGKATPACDVSDDGRWFAHADNGKITVWKVDDKSKLVDAWDVVKLAPEFSRGGVVAVYFPKSAIDAKDAPPKRVVTVSSIGAVHLWDLANKQLLGPAFIPQQGRANRVTDMKSVTLGPGRGSVVIAVGGVIYSVDIGEDRVFGSVFVDLGGDVPTSFGLSASASGPVLYAFETGGDKKERVVRLINTKGVSRSWRWPDSAGTPTGAGWVNAEKAVVSSSRGGLIWFELTDKNFFPEGIAFPTADKGKHMTNDQSHWYLIPHPADPKKSALCQMIQTAPVDEPAELLKGTIPTWRLDAKGMWK